LLYTNLSPNHFFCYTDDVASSTSGVPVISLLGAVRSFPLFGKEIVETAHEA
jgi:hypothetical protein